MRRRSAPELADPSRVELGTRVRRGMGWKAVSESTLFVSRLGVTIILARLLAPEDFGVAGMVLVLSAFVIPLADLGMGSALVQRRLIADVDRSTMFWAAIMIGLAFTLAGIAVADLAARFYGEPEVRSLFAALSLSFVITSLGATHRSLLSRTMDFRRLELRTMASFLLGGVVAVVLALAGFGPWALVAQSLTIVSVSTVLLWVLVPWAPKWTFSTQTLRELGSFGIRSLVGTIFGSLTQVTDKLVVGRFLGATPLGLYVFAFNIMLQPLTRILTPVQQVLYPALSRMHDDEHGRREAWLRANRALLAVCTPLMVGAFVTAPDLVPLVFGAKWSGAVPVFQILAFGGIALCVQALYPVVLQAVDRTTSYLRLSAAGFALSLGATLVGLSWGVEGVAIGYAGAGALIAVASTVCSARALGVPLRGVGASLRGLLEASGAMLVGGIVCRELLDGRASEVRLLVTSAGSAAMYFLVVAVRDAELLSELRSLLSQSSTNVPTAASRHAGEP